MNHHEVINYIHGAKLWGAKAGLANTLALLGLLGNPQNGLRCVHVAGTNGKGSLCALVERALRENGLKTGLYTSPYLSRYNERMRVDGLPIADALLVKIGSEVIAQVEILRGRGIAPTVFEIGTAIALQYFAEQAVDIAVIEVGIGGLTDPTNVINPCVTAIAAIGLDHMIALGGTLPEIARIKAGIAKPGVPMVLAPAIDEVHEVVLEVCGSVGAPVWDMAGLEIQDENCSGQKDGVAGGESKSFSLRGAIGGVSVNEPCVKISLRGDHQRVAAAQALCVLELLRRQGFALERGQNLAGLKATRWPGRLEMICGTPDILLDGAHNPQGANALADYVRSSFPGRRVVLVCAVSRDKQVEEIIEILSRVSIAAVASPVDNPRTLPAQALAERFDALGFMCQAACDSADAINRARALAGPEGLVLVAGSLYLVGEVRPLLLPGDDGRL